MDLTRDYCRLSENLKSDKYAANSCKLFSLIKLVSVEHTEHTVLSRISFRENCLAWLDTKALKCLDWVQWWIVSGSVCRHEDHPPSHPPRLGGHLSV